VARKCDRWTAGACTLEGTDRQGVSTLVTSVPSPARPPTGVDIRTAARAGPDVLPEGVAGVFEQMFEHVWQ
jgi:hypothetical protein